ncbi:MAG: PAS domain-containing protein [Puniceicoccales bacterium]
MAELPPNADGPSLREQISRLEAQLHAARNETDALKQRVQFLSKGQLIGGMGGWEMDPASGRICLSSELHQLFDLHPEVNPTVDELLLAIHPDDREKARKVLVEPPDSHKQQTAQVRLRDAQGTVRWVQLIAQGDQSSESQRRYGVVQDISQLAQAEHELAASRERWQLALEGSDDGVWDWDLANNDVHYSDRWKQMLGYEPHEIHCGLDQWERLVHPEDLPAAMKATQNYLKGKCEQFQEEFRMRAKDGTWRWILSRGKAIFDAQGKPTRMLGTHADITHRKKQEEAFKRLSLVASKTTTGVVITDAGGRFTWINKAFERLTGYTMAEVLGKSPGSLLQGAATDRNVATAMREAVRLGQGFHVEVLNYRKSGVPYWVEVEATPVHDADGRLTSFIAIETDITNRRLDRERIEESERRFRDISNAAGEYIWESDINGCFTYVTERVKDVLGYTPGEFIGMHHVDLSPADCRDVIGRRIEAVISQRGELSNFEVRALHRDGHEIWQSINGVPRFDRRGNWVGYRGAAMDITRRKQIEQELSKVNRRFELATNSAQIGIWEYDPVNDRLEWDAIMHEIFSLPRERFRSNMEAWSYVVFPEDLPDFQHTLETALRTGGNYRLNFRISQPGEDIRHMTGNALVLLDDNRKPFRMIGSNWEVTDQKRAEAKAIQSRDEAEAANRAKGAFLAMMSHEIRTPMNGVIGMIDMLSDTKLNERQREYLDTVRSSSESLMTIINDILDYSKVDAGRMELQLKSVQVEPLLRHALSLFSTHAAEKKLELVLRVDDNVPAAIQGDETRIRQVLMNLISNAVKFTDQGRVTVKVSSTPQLDDRCELHFSVADTGVGLDEKKQQMLFQPFTQADIGSSRRYGGTGLGLAISKRLVELMGGRIWFESSRMLGTIFHFTIETRAAAPVDAPATPKPISQPGKCLYSGRILLAEDNPVNCKVACFVLNRFGCSADIANNGLEAFKLFQEKPYDLILMDVQMPEMDGLEATRKIREHSGSSDSPWIIGLSAAAMQEDADIARQAGMNDFITKPLRPADLEAALLRAPALERVES